MGFRLENAGRCGIAEKVDPDHFGHPKNICGCADFAKRSLKMAKRSPLLRPLLRH
jgi:hypothetical protein